MEYVLPAVLALGVLLFVIGWLVVIVTSINRHPFMGILALIPGLNVLVLPAIWHRVGGWVITSIVGVLLAVGAWFMGAGDQLKHHLKGLGVDIGTPVVQVAAPANAQQATGGVQTIEIPRNAQGSAVQAPVATTAETTPLALPKAGSAGNTPPAATQTLELPKAGENTPATAPVPAAAPATSANTPAAPLPLPTEELPANALYRLEFKDVAVDKLNDAEGKYIRVTQKDGRKREGKIQSISDGEITLEERVDGGMVTRPLKIDEVRQAAMLMKSQED